MSEIMQKPKRRLNKYMTALIVVVCITLIISVTFAWFTYRADKNITFTIGQVQLSVDYCPAIADGEFSKFVESGCITNGQTVDNTELVCNKPLISHYRFSNYETADGVNSVDCYVRVLFEFTTTDDNAQALVEELNKNPIDTYLGLDAHGAKDYGWVRLDGTNYYYLVEGATISSGETAQMYKVVNQDKQYTFAEKVRFPNIEILNHDLLVKIGYRIKVQAIQANYLMYKNDDNIYVDVDGTIKTIYPLMDEVFTD